MKGKRESLDESIRIEAYLLSEKAGHPAHMEHYFWTEAQAIVEARATAVAVAIKTAAAKPASQRTKAKPTVAVKPKAEAKAPAKAKPKAVRKPAAKSIGPKEPQLPLSGETTAPAAKRKTKK